CGHKLDPEILGQTSIEANEHVCETCKTITEQKRKKEQKNEALKQCMLEGFDMQESGPFTIHTCAELLGLPESLQHLEEMHPNLGDDYTQFMRDRIVVETVDLTALHGQKVSFENQNDKSMEGGAYPDDFEHSERQVLSHSGDNTIKFVTWKVENREGKDEKSKTGWAAIERNAMSHKDKVTISKRDTEEAKKDIYNRRRGPASGVFIPAVDPADDPECPHMSQFRTKLSISSDHVMVFSLFLPRNVCTYWVGPRKDGKNEYNLVPRGSIDRTQRHPPTAAC
ncbi:MAG: hypothetical protein SGARI_004932, partial [Bacillariaceae sp.]